MIIMNKPAYYAIIAVLMLGFSSLVQADADWTSGIRINTGSESYIKLGGRLHLDYASINDDVTAMDGGFEARRARATIRGRFGDDWRASVDWDGGTIQGWKNVFVQFRGFDKLVVTAGNQLVPFGFEPGTSSNATTFMERALPDALNSHFLMGVSVRGGGSNWTLTGGYFGDGLSDNDTRTSNGTSVAGRFTFAPIRSKKQVLHLGAAAEYRELDNNSGFRVGARPESYANTVKLIDTGAIDDASSVTTYGLEAAALMGRFSIQGEYVSATADRDVGPQVTFNGGYVAASWFVSGGQKRYSKSTGSFQAPRIRGKSGAWEIAARYSTLDLQDQDISGGKQSDITLGVNWYLNRQIRLMFNAVHAEASPNLGGVDESVDILQVRFQATI
jgi:phosphate-selective porin OprO/OprP